MRCGGDAAVSPCAEWSIGGVNHSMALRAISGVREVVGEIGGVWGRSRPSTPGPNMAIMERHIQPGLAASGGRPPGPRGPGVQGPRGTGGNRGRRLERLCSLFPLSNESIESVVI